MVDSIYRTRSLGVAAEGLPDQYADGKAAKVWEYYVGCKQARTSSYKTWIVNILKEYNCRNVLDVACGTGIDSIMLLEEGFNVVSTDASDKMLKYALKERWNRRKEAALDKWVIEEANWLTLTEDFEDIPEKPEAGFDAVICLGNSFAHLPDFEGQNRKQLLALENFRAMVKPGGILLVDHRNYDEIIRSGKVPTKNIYYNSSHITGITTSNLYVDAKPTLITLDYRMDISILRDSQPTQNSSVKKLEISSADSTQKFRLSYYPHLLEPFNSLLKQIFSKQAKHSIFGDFKPLSEVDCPAYYIHCLQRPPKEETS